LNWPELALSVVPCYYKMLLIMFQGCFLLVVEVIQLVLDIILDFDDFIKPLNPVKHVSLMCLVKVEEDFHQLKHSFLNFPHKWYDY
jgi:hypothetical protein